MLTPLLMLLILTLPTMIAEAGRRTGLWRPPRGAAATGLALLFLFTASGHFLQTAAMREMLPPWIPLRTEIVLATGLLEIGIAAALLWPRTRRMAAWTAIAVLVAFFPANVYAAFVHADMGGHVWGPEYLLIRAPLQLILVGWAWLFLLAPKNAEGGLAGAR